MPDGIEDRNADVWEPLLAVADVADGTWPERARLAAVALVADLQERKESLGIRLLSDVREVFDRTGDVAASTDALLTELGG